MLDEFDLRRLLVVAAHRAGQAVSPDQLDEATEELRKRRRAGWIAKADMEAVSLKVAKDPCLFVNIDTGEVTEVAHLGTGAWSKAKPRRGARSRSAQTKLLGRLQAPADDD